MCVLSHRHFGTDRSATCVRAGARSAMSVTGDAPAVARAGGGESCVWLIYALMALHAVCYQSQAFHGNQGARSGGGGGGGGKGRGKRGEGGDRRGDGAGGKEGRWVDRLVGRCVPPFSSCWCMGCSSRWSDGRFCSPREAFAGLVRPPRLRPDRNISVRGARGWFGKKGVGG